MKDNENIVLIGMPGCGKTTVGNLLAKELGYDFIDIDKKIESRFGAISELFEKGEEYFRRCETECAIDASKSNSTVIATGGGIVTRKENMSALSDTGIIFFLNRAVENIMKDIISDTRPLLADGKEKLYELYDQRIDLYYEYADIVIDSDKTLEEVVSDILKQVKES